MAAENQQVTVVIRQGLTKRQVFIYFLRLLKGLIVLSLLVDVAAYVLTMIGGILGSSLDTVDRVFIVLSSIGFCLLCGLMIAAEFEPKWLVENMKITRFWGARGGAHAWLGIQTIYSVQQLAASLASVSDGRKRIDVTRWIGTVVGYMLISIGLLYALFSALCLRNALQLDGPFELDEDRRLNGAEVTLNVPLSPRGGSEKDDI